MKTVAPRYAGGALPPVKRQKGERKAEQLRSCFLKVDVNSQAEGSAYVESERAKAYCAVYGPRPTSKAEYSERARLNCDVKLASFSGRGERLAPGQSERERELSLLLRKALESTVMLQKYPKSAIDVYVLVLESDGSLLASLINAAALALADAGIDMLDTVVAACAGRVEGETFIDLTEDEEQLCDGRLVVSYMPSLNQVTQVEQSGEIELEALLEMLEMAIDAATQTHLLMKNAMVEARRRRQREK